MPVIADFVDAIVGGTFAPGTTLPSEAAMCEHLGVSRTVLREVLKSLEQKGLVQVLNGVGTRTTHRGEWKLLDPLVLAARIRGDKSDKFVADLVRVRIILEAEMARSAAEKATDVQIAGFHAQCEQLGAALSKGDVGDYFRRDVEFHDLIMLASGNETARAVVLTLNDQARAGLHYEAIDIRQLDPSQHDHVLICKALAEHDADGAARLMAEHIEAGWLLRSA